MSEEKKGTEVTKIVIVKILSILIYIFLASLVIWPIWNMSVSFMFGLPQSSFLSVVGLVTVWEVLLGARASSILSVLHAMHDS